MKRDALDDGEDSHRDTAGDSTLDAGRVWIDFERQYCAIAELADLQTIDADCRRNDGCGGRLDANHLVMLVGKHVAKPSDCARDKQNEADHADRDVSDEAGEGERQAEREDHRPRGRCGSFD